MPPVIRTAREEDWPAIVRIQHECFPPSAIESREILHSIAEHSPENCLFAEDDGPAGYLLAHPWTAEDFPPAKDVLPGIPADSTSLFIHDLAVSLRARGRDVARSLVTEALARARASGLTQASLVSVQGSGGFWERFGFRVRPELTERFAKIFREHYGLDCVFMTAGLSSETSTHTGTGHPSP